MEDNEQFDEIISDIKKSLKSLKETNETEDSDEEETIEDVNPTILLLFSQKKRIRRSTEFKYFFGYHEGNATDSFKNILDGTIEKILNTDLIDDFNEDNPEAHVVIDLSTVDNWEHYENAIKDITIPELENLKTLKTSLNNFILAYVNDEIIIGQIRRLYARQVLVDNDKTSFMFNGAVFDDAEKNDDRIEIDDDFDVFFILKEDKKMAITKNHDIFNEIFDMYDQIEKEALEVISESNVYEFFEDKTKIIEIAKSDRNIQNMLRNKITNEAFAIVTIDNLSEAKTKLGDLVNFKINDNGKILLSSEKEKESLKGVIKAAGYYYNESLYGNHIIEGRPTQKLT